MGDSEVNKRSIGRRSFLALAALGLIGLVEGCSGASEQPVSPSETPAPPSRTPTLVATLPPASEEPAAIYTITDFRPRLEVMEGFRVYNTLPSEIDLARWRLRVDGLVSNPIEFTIEDILSFPPVVETKDFVCGSYWDVKNVRWQGVRPNVLLDAAGVAPEARSVKIYSMDGRTIAPCRLIRPGSGALLAYGANYERSPRTRLPAPLVVPLMIGVWSIKWIDRIELVLKTP